MKRALNGFEMCISFNNISEALDRRYDEIKTRGMNLEQMQAYYLAKMWKGLAEAHYSLLEILKIIMKRYFDKVVLIKKKNRYSETRLSAYKRYINTIKPLEDLIKYIDGDNDINCLIKSINNTKEEMKND